MCGVAFLYQPGLSSEEARHRIEIATKQLAHRGPDDCGIASEQGWAIGHTRLSIVDLVGSQQPIWSPDKRFVLSFNGEIYNYQVLREELKAVWNFTTQGDTELVLAGLIRYGTDFFQKMSGMWAIVFFDTELKKVIMSRDRFGKKPLYYIPSVDGLCAASEVPALKPLNAGLPLQESPQARADFFRYGFFRPGTSSYQEIKEVKAGHVLEYCFEHNGINVKELKYWSLDRQVFDGNAEEAAEVFRDLFKSSVRNRIIADVEIGVLLSGGVDSSLISAVAKKDFNQSLRTFSIGFESKSYDELGDARFVANFLGVGNTSEVVAELNPDTAFELISNHCGQPFGDASILPMALVAQLAAKHVKVCLTGDGADEVFSGYQRYQARLMYHWYKRVPAPLRKVFSNLVNSLPASQAHHSRSVVKKAQLFDALINRYEHYDDFLVPRILQPEDEALLFPQLADFDRYVPSSARSEQDDLSAMMISDLSMYLPQDILLKADRASMAHSLELRSPFLDHKLVEFAFSLPREWHRKGFKGKRLIQRSMESYLPSRVWNKRKQGFALPLGDWFIGRLGDRFNELLADSKLEPEWKAGLKKALDLHRSRTKDYSLFLWPALTYLHWYHLEGKG